MSIRNRVAFVLLILFVLGVALANPAAAAQPAADLPAAMGPEAKTPGPSARQVAMMWAAAYNRHDADAAADLYDVNVVNVQMPYGKPIQGRDAMRATYAKIFQAFPDIHVEIGTIIEAAPWVAVEWTFSGTMQGDYAGHPPNQSRFTMRGCELFQVVDGKILTQRGYWDKATMFTQLGLKLDP